MLLLWFLLGVSFFIAIIISYQWIKYEVPLFSLFTGILGVVAFLFAIAWVIVSMYNGEPITASSGMLSFGTAGICLIGIGWMLSLKAINKKSN